MEKWEEIVREKFKYMIDAGIKDGFWTEEERVAFMVVSARVIRDFRQVLHKQEREIVNEFAEVLIKAFDATMQEDWKSWEVSSEIALRRDAFTSRE